MEKKQTKGVKINNPRLLLSKLRNGDFAHAGDREAIDIVLSELDKLKAHSTFSEKKMIKQKEHEKILDVGCGYGGTADYIRHKINCDMYAIDIDPVAIAHASRHYSGINLFNVDVFSVDKILDLEYFDIILMFNVFYCLANQKEALKKLIKIAKPGAFLVIFDYVKLDNFKDQLIDFSGKLMNPMRLDELSKDFVEVGWELIKFVDITQKYHNWYGDFLQKLKANKNLLLNEFDESVIHNVESTFASLVCLIEKKHMGGGIVYARKMALV